MKKRVSVIMLSFLFALNEVMYNGNPQKRLEFVSGDRTVTFADDRNSLMAAKAGFCFILYSRNFISALARSGQHKVMCWKSSVYLAESFFYDQN